MFGVFSIQDVYVNTIVKSYDAAPGNNATENIFIEDKNMTITNIAVGEVKPLQVVQAEFKDRTFFADKGSKFEVYHNDDFSDSTTQITLIFGYIYEPPTING